MASIHEQRAKRWKTSPFAAEWFANTVEYCHNNADGKRVFEKWAMQKYGGIVGRVKIRTCQKPAQKIENTEQRKDAMRLNDAAVELGVCEDALSLYCEFTAERHICSPERIKPAPRRRRGEGATEWLTRSKAAILDGCKLPDMDWHLARAIALSEFDKVRDTMYIWRTCPEVFMEAVAERGQSTIPFPTVLEQPPEYQAYHKMDDAFRTLTHLNSVAYLTWSYSAALFEDLARMGLTTPLAIEHAYKQDTKLLWRLVSCFTRIQCLLAIRWGKLAHTVTWSEHFRPYFRRWRTENGTARIERNPSYIRQHPISRLSIEELVITQMSDGSTVGEQFFERLLTHMAEDPSHATKFTSEAFNELGDVSNLYEFCSHVFGSPFGERLREHAMTFKGTGLQETDFVAEVHFMDASKLATVPKIQRDNLWGNAGAILASTMETWLQIMSDVTMWDLGFTTVFITGDKASLPAVVDAMWQRADQVLWDRAHSCDAPGEPGKLARSFGLFDPQDANRPSFAMFISRDPDEALQPTTTPAPSLHRTRASLSSASADLGNGASALGKLDGPPASEGHGANSLSRSEIGDILVSLAEDNEHGALPENLPAQFKLGKKGLKVLHRLLDEDSPEEPESNAKKPILRWADFEKAMKRIGFDVVHTVGSAVRFDPPAKTARPIAFQRPHPDPILTPEFMKLLALRLRKCYGWTMATFVRGQGDE